MATNFIMLNVLIEREITALKQEILKAQTDFDINNYAVDYLIANHKETFQDMLMEHGMDASLIKLIDIDSSDSIQDYDVRYLEICLESYELEVAQEYAKLCVDMMQILNVLQGRAPKDNIEGLIPQDAFKRYEHVEMLLLHSPYHEWMHDITVFDVQRKIDETKFNFFNAQLRDRASNSATFVLALQYHLLLKNLQIYLKRPYKTIEVESVIRRYHE
ncbi:MAG: hypothetical protein RR565_03615 [Erysipelothrix sp.]